MQKLYPEWRSLVIHESSPMMRGAIIKLFNECPRLMQSQYYTDEQSRKSIPHGIYQDLQHLTFEDESIDIHITQDVMEHVLNPEKDFKEIARTLRPCGAHIFTVPLVNKNNQV